MCGINGIISRHSINRLDDRIQAMNKALKHRGPDADHFKIITTGVALGHRRLAILDLDPRSDQPMSLGNDEWSIVYNGEIFNYKELRKELRQYYTFRTESDTEVLLAGIAFKGIEWTLKNANGMFAFAAYNSLTKQTFLGRDRFGIKPLFYTLCGDVLIFSSEIKGILNSGLVKPLFRSEAVDEYLAYRYIREPNTFFSDIFQLKSSTYMVFDRILCSEEIIYWKLPRLNFDERLNEKELITDTEEAIKNAFDRWFISDVKVGSYLSGGVDSSLTTALLALYLKRPVDTYTIGFEEKKFNEFEFAEIVAEQYQTNHHSIISSISDYMDGWDRLIYYKDAPLAVPNEIPLAKMSTILSQQIKVVISGEGADELFGGYGNIFRSAFDYSNKHKDNETFCSYFLDRYEYANRNLRNKYLDVDFSQSIKYKEKLEKEFSYFSNEENIFRFFHQSHIQGLLQRVDMTTMQASVEARPPFLDHELIEFVYSKVPYSMKLHWNNVESQIKAMQGGVYSEILDTPKYILKKVSEKYLPDEVIYRRKMGFPVPLTHWYEDLRVIAVQLLQDADWLKENSLEMLINDLKCDPRAGQLLWMFVNIQKFHNMYFNKKWLW